MVKKHENTKKLWVKFYNKSFCNFVNNLIVLDILVIVRFLVTIKFENVKSNKSETLSSCKGVESLGGRRKTMSSEVEFCSLQGFFKTRCFMGTFEGNFF